MAVAVNAWIVLLCRSTHILIQPLDGSSSKRLEPYAVPQGVWLILSLDGSSSKRLDSSAVPHCRIARRWVSEDRVPVLYLKLVRAANCISDKCCAYATKRVYLAPIIARLKLRLPL